ncbi:MAG: VTT domain-containing protein [Candidatus Pacebacteria bacterium]|nr:VTT domain-containing protein [Candidatus Paceibacterota bacterium]
MFYGIASSLSPYFLNLLLEYKYFILFPILVIEGPIATVLSGILASPDFGVFNLYFLYPFVIFSDLVGDTLYYCIGRYAGERAIKKFTAWRGVKTDYEQNLKNYFKKYGGVSLIISKVSHGLGWPMMVAAGSAEYSYRKFLGYIIPTSILKSAVLIGIGYFYEEDASRIVAYVGTTATVITAVVIVLAVIIYFIQKKKSP